MKKIKKSKMNKTAKENPINAKMSFAEVINKYPESAEVFFKHGMACFGCPAAMMETLGDGIKAHGHDAKKIIDELNKAVKKKLKK